jgi:protein-S-isoprenylcysteine O-methyltransferase Ste14
VVDFTLGVQVAVSRRRAHALRRRRANSCRRSRARGFIRAFRAAGLGTPAPIAPTQHLVVTGLNRYVRNPIYVTVAAVIFGQALLFGDWRLFAYGAVVWLVFHLFVVGYEEPTLKRSFGAEYEAFCINVPRWIPRLTAWRGGR